MKTNFKDTLILIDKETAIEYRSNIELLKEEKKEINHVFSKYFKVLFEQINDTFNIGGIDVLISEFEKYIINYGLFVDIKTGAISEYTKEKSPDNFIHIGKDKYLLSKGISIMLLEGLDGFKDFVNKDIVWRFTVNYIVAVSEYELHNDIEIINTIEDKKEFNENLVSQVNIKKLSEQIASQLLIDIEHNIDTDLFEEYYVSYISTRDSVSKIIRKAIKEKVTEFEYELVLITEHKSEESVWDSILDEIKEFSDYDKTIDLQGLKVNIKFYDSEYNETTICRFTITIYFS